MTPSARAGEKVAPAKVGTAAVARLTASEVTSARAKMRTSERRPTNCVAAFEAAPSPLTPMARGVAVEPVIATASCALLAR